MKWPRVKRPILKRRSRDKKEISPDPMRLLPGAAKGKKFFGPVATAGKTFGSAEEILGVMINPNTRYVRSVVSWENGSVPAAILSSLDNPRLMREIQELELLELNVEDEDKKEKIKDEIDQRVRKVKQESRAIVYHEGPTSVPLLNVMDYVDKASFLLRSFPRDVAPFTNRLDSVKKWGNSQYAAYIEDYKYMVTQTKDPTLDLTGLTVRDLIYWGEADQLIPDERELTASLYGKIPTLREAAWFMFGVMERYPLRITNRAPLTFEKYRGNPLRFACPKVPRFEDDYYVVNDRAYRIFKIPLVFSEEFFTQLLSLDVDLLLCVDMEQKETGRSMYETALLRTSSEIVGGKFPKLETITRQVRRLKGERLTGQDQRLAYQAYVPGSDILDAEVRYRLHDKLTPSEAKFLFEAIRQRVNAGKASSEGNFFFGFRGGNRNSPVFGDAESECVSVAIVGQQGAGKTTTGWAIFSLPRTPNALAIQLSTARGEGAPNWARRFAGNVLNIELDDADDEDKDQRFKRQEELMVLAVKRAKELVNQLKTKWKETGLPVGLPLVVRPVKDTISYQVFALTLLEDFSLAWEECFIEESVQDAEREEELSEKLIFEEKETSDKESEVELAVDDPKLCLVFLDDISNLDVESVHPTLGEIPRNVAHRFREQVGDGLYNYRKRRMAMIVTHQAVTSLIKYYPLDAFSSLVLIDLDEKTGEKKVTIYDPKGANKLEDMKVKVKDLDSRLEPYVLNYLLRLEDKAPM